MSRFLFKNHTNLQAGQAILTAVIFFVVISLTIVLGIATPVLQSVKIGNDLIHSKASYFLAEGGLEDATYRVEAGKTVNNGDSITVNGYTTTISVTSGLNGQVYEATSNYGGLYRSMQAEVTTGTGISFTYALQTGAGGFYISGGSQLIGSLYSNGPVYGNGSGKITGTVASANSASLTADQSNTTPTPIGSCTSSTCVTFGNASATQDAAQQFQVSTDGPLHDIQFYIKKIGSPSNITVRIVGDNGGSPGSTDLLSSDGTIAASSVGTSFGWVDVTFPSNSALYAGSTYWIVLDTSNNSSNYYTIGANSSYANGVAKIGKWGTSWSATSPAGLDLYFNLYLGGAYGQICGSSNGTSCDGGYVGEITVGNAGAGDAWAHQVQAATIAGHMYCQVGGGSGSPYYDNKASCDTSKDDPPAVAMPITDSNISDWEDQATPGVGWTNPAGAWTYNGNLTTNSAGTTTSTLTKITGNFATSGGGGDTFSSGLEVDGNMTISSGSVVNAGPLLVKGNLDVQSTGLVLNGTLWVQGTLTVESGGYIKLGAGYGNNSGVIIVSSYINLTGGSGLLVGNGNPNSYLLLVTPSDCPISAICGGNPAINISGGSGAIVLEAPHGTISMSGGTAVNAMAANKVTMSGGSTLTYNSGVASLDFTGGPTGGYSVSSWQEVQ